MDTRENSLGLTQRELAEQIGNQVLTAWVIAKQERAAFLQVLDEKDREIQRLREELQAINTNQEDSR